MRTFRRYAFFAFITITFFACKKDKSASKDRLVMIRTTERDSISWRIFSYNAENRLSGIIDSNNNGFRRRMLISYDAQGKLYGAFTGAQFFKFEYDNNGRVSRKLVQDLLQTSWVRDTYSYDASGRLTTDTAYEYWGSSIYSITTYAYDAVGNVTTARSKDTSGNTIQEQQCSYDDHVNPFDGKNILIYLLDREEGNLPAGKNNIFRQTFNDGTIVYYTYQYNHNGLPKSCSVYDNYDPLVEYVDYFYQ